jgi:surface-anchored protein
MHTQRFRSVLVGLLLASAFVLGGSPSARAQAVLTNEHADIGIGYAGGVWNLHVHDEDNDLEFDPADVLLFVAPEARTSRPAGSAFDFIGVGAGENYWRLPQTQNPSLLFLGVSAGEVAPGTFGSYNPFDESGGRVSGSGPWLRLDLLGISGPGHFSVWQSTDTGPLVFMSSFQNGVDGSDSLWIPDGSHAHFNYGFTGAGLYDITFKASGLIGGQRVESGPVTYRFGVETQGGEPGAVIPEPGSIALMAAALPLGMAALLRPRRRRAAA